jgi:hypothetical protein
MGGDRPLLVQKLAVCLGSCLLCLRRRHRRAQKDCLSPHVVCFATLRGVGSGALQCFGQSPHGACTLPARHCSRGCVEFESGQRRIGLCGASCTSTTFLVRRLQRTCCKYFVSMFALEPCPVLCFGSAIPSPMQLDGFWSATWDLSRRMFQYPPSLALAFECLLFLLSKSFLCNGCHSLRLNNLPSWGCFSNLFYFRFRSFLLLFLCGWLLSNLPIRTSVVKDVSRTSVPGARFQKISWL